MKSLDSRFTISRLIVFVITVSIFAGQTMVALAMPKAGQSAGELTVKGKMPTDEKPFVLVNGDRSFTGRSVFSSGTIATTETTSAIINLGKVGRIELARSSVMTLTFSDNSISGVLSSGDVRVSNADGVAVKIDTPNDVVTNDGNAASSFSVLVSNNTSSVAATSGTVRYNHGATVAKQQDDDDDDDDGIWVPLVVIGGAVAAVVLVTVIMNDDDEDFVSPVF
ncbi:MAG TPA: hypothetical protein VJV05_12880 [Pyrinomonadaceae bacterium]|nr:hypothetical protein [Pyrinomonadaceae bacterium]